MAPILSRPFLALGLAAMIGGCSLGRPERLPSRCAALSSSDWSAGIETAWTNHGKPQRRRSLVVNGAVALPNGNYTLALEPGSIQRVRPRLMQVHLRVAPVEDSAASAPVTRQVTGRFPYNKRAEGISIRCGDGILIESLAIEQDSKS